LRHAERGAVRKMRQVADALTQDEERVTMNDVKQTEDMTAQMKDRYASCQQHLRDTQEELQQALTAQADADPPQRDGRRREGAVLLVASRQQVTQGMEMARQVTELDAIRRRLESQLTDQAEDHAAKEKATVAE
jgi:hypothetical protein